MSVVAKPFGDRLVRDQDLPAPGPRGTASDHWVTTGSGSAASGRDRFQPILTRVPRWSARLVFVLGLLTIASAVLPRRRHLLAWPIELLPPLGLATVSVIGIGVGFGLIIMARGLRHRKQTAWRAVVTLLVVGIGLHLLRGVAPIQTGISATVVTVLILGREQFAGRRDTHDRRSVPRVFTAMALSCWMVGAIGTRIDSDDLVAGWTGSELLVHTLLGLVGLPGPLAFTSPATAEHNAVELLGLGVLVVVVTLAALLRSTPEPVGERAWADRSRVRALLERGEAADSLGYFALRHDKLYAFSPSGKAAIGYRVVSGVCLAAADPVGDVEAWPGAIEAWLDLTRRYAWVPAALAVSETGAQAYRRAGLDCVEMGDEAILDVADFSIDGRPMRTVRQAVTRARKSGHTTTIAAVSEFTTSDRQTLDSISTTWRTGGAERGFSMALSRFGADEDPRSVIVQGRSADGDLVGVLQLVPWGRDGWSLDLMRRHPDLSSGVMEMMIADLMNHARGCGIKQVSLNFVFFRSSLARSERVGAGPVLRAWVAVLLFASRWLQIASLYRADAKFRPRWEPRFLSFAGVSDLGQIITAALRAEGLFTISRLQPVRRTGPKVDPNHPTPSVIADRSSGTSE